MFAVLIPVGPGGPELDRLTDTLDSIRSFEASDEVHLVLVDDNPSPRDLASAAGDWGTCEVIRTPLWRAGTPDPYSAMVAGTVEGLRVAGRHRPEFLLKLDTDALLIGATAHRLRAAFADERVGLVGSYTHTCTGARRDWSGWEKKLRRARRPVAVGPRGAVRLRSPRSARAVRQVLRRALDNGYEWGAHCLGGAYAAGPALLNRADLLDWRPWVGTWVSEDVVVGILAFAAGLRISSCVDVGEVFGLAWQSLPLPPEELVGRGHGVVHSVRDQAYGTERELRVRLRALASARRDD